MKKSSSGDLAEIFHVPFLMTKNKYEMCIHWFCTVQLYNTYVVLFLMLFYFYVLKCTCLYLPQFFVAFERDHCIAGITAFGFSPDILSSTRTWIFN